MERYSTAAVAQLLQQRMVNNSGVKVGTVGTVGNILCEKVLLLTATDLIGSSEV